MPIDDEPDDDSTHHTWRPAHGPLTRLIAWIILGFIALSLATMFAAWVRQLF